MTRKTTVVDDVMNDDDDEQDIPTFESVNDNGSVTPTAAAEVVDDEEVVEVLSNAPVWQFEDPQFEAGDMAMPRIKLAQMQTRRLLSEKPCPVNGLSETTIRSMSLFLCRKPWQRPENYEMTKENCWRVARMEFVAALAGVESVLPAPMLNGIVPTRIT